MRRTFHIFVNLFANWMPVALPIGVLAVMVFINPTLLRPANWERICRTWAGVAFLAMGLTPIVITGGIDLSVGSVVGFSAVTVGALWQSLGWPLEMALCGGLFAGLAAGMVNGAVVLTGINPLVVTLATLAVFRGFAYGLSGQRAVDNFPAGLRDWWDADWLGLPRPLCLVLLVFVLIHVFVHHTWMGRMLFAIGDNRVAARFAGVPIRTLTFSLYALSGLLGGLGGIASVCEFRSAAANEGENLELRAVACVVLGGTRITGGSGRVAGTLLGTLTLAALIEGMVSIRSTWRPMATGLLLIFIAVANEFLARLRTKVKAGISS